MKTKVLLLIMLVGTAWLVSCSKDDNNNLPGFPMVSTITAGDSSSQFTLELRYDSENRLVSYGFGDTIVMSYTYGNGTVTRKIFGMPGVTLITDVFTLNSQGQAISSVSYSNQKGTFKPSFPVPGGFTGDSSFTTYEYDANGYMIKMVIISSDTVTFSYSVLNGNVVSETSTNGTSHYTFTYEHRTDKANTIGNENMGIYFLGKQNANLIGSASNGSLVEPYTYEFDSKDRVIRQTILDGPSYGFTYRE